MLRMLRPSAENPDGEDKCGDAEAEISTDHTVVNSSAEEIFNAFEELTACKQSDLPYDFSFESILDLGALPHGAHEAVYERPVPKPRFTTVPTALCRTPPSCTVKRTLKSSPFGVDSWKYPSQESVFSSINAMLAQPKRQKGAGRGRVQVGGVVVA